MQIKSMLTRSTWLLKYKMIRRLQNIKKPLMQNLKIFPVKKKHFGHQFTKLLKIHISHQQSYFQQNFSDPCRNNSNNPQNIPNKIKAAFQKCLWNGGCMHKWLIFSERSHRINRKNKIHRNITFKENQQDQDVDFILIMCRQKKISGHKYQISIKTV